MRFLLGVSRSIDWFTEGLGRAMFWVTLLMVLIGAYNVVTRYLGQYIGVQLSSNVYLELQTYAYDLIFLLGAAYTFKHDAHVRVDILYSTRSKRTKAVIDIIGAALFLLPFCILGMYFSWDYVGNSWRVLETSPNAGGLPRYPIKTVIIIAFGLLIVQGVSETIKNIAILKGMGPADKDGRITEQMESI